MNMDERPEALLRSAEAHDRQIVSHDRPIETHDRQIEALLSLAAKHDAEISALRLLWNDVAEGIGCLVHAAEIHGQRLDSVDERLDNLENG
jgi:hypothetical protein